MDLFTELEHFTIRKSLGERIVLWIGFIASIFCLLCLGIVEISDISNHNIDKDFIFLFGFFIVVFLILLIPLIKAMNWKIEVDNKVIHYTSGFGTKQNIELYMIHQAIRPKNRSFLLMDNNNRRLIKIPSNMPLSKYILLVAWLLENNIEILYDVNDQVFNELIKTYPEMRKMDDSRVENGVYVSNMDDSVIVDSDGNSIKEYEPEKENVKFARKNFIAILAIGSYLLAFVLFYVVLLSHFSGNIKCMLLAVTFILPAVFTSIQGLKLKKEDTCIRMQGDSIRAKITKTIPIDKNGNLRIYFEFQQDDKWFLRAGLYTMTAKEYHKYYVEGSFTDIYFAPDISNFVSFRTKVRHPLRNCLIYVCAVIAVLTAGFFFVTGNLSTGDKSEVGVSLEMDIDEDASVPDYDTVGQISAEDTDTVKWICASYGIHSYVNHINQLQIGGNIATGNNERYKEKLENGWGITDRKSAEETLNHLLEYGSRSKYNALHDSVKKKGLLDSGKEAFQDEIKNYDSEKKVQYSVVWNAHYRVGKSGIDAWDYCRALELLGDFYQCGYYSLDECLDQSFIIAKQLQSEYDSWDELCQSYLYGYEFWSKTNANEQDSDSFIRNERYDELCDSDDNPYKQISYNTILEKEW